MQDENRRTGVCFLLYFWKCLWYTIEQCLSCFSCVLFLFCPYGMKEVRWAAKTANCGRDSSWDCFSPIWVNVTTKIKCPMTNFCLIGVFLLWNQRWVSVQNENKQKLFKLHSEYQPTGDQPQAIDALVKGFKEGNQFQTLLGVTGSERPLPWPMWSHSLTSRPW